MKKNKIILLFLLINTAIHGQTYRQLFDKLNTTFSTQDYSFYTQLIISRVEVNAAIMESYINMYEATKDKKYLNKFLVCSKKAKDRRDDFIVKHNNFYTSNEINTSAEFETFNCL